MDQASILAEHFIQRNVLVKWDSFSRFTEKSLLKKLFFNKKSSRLVSNELMQLDGAHYLPEVIGHSLKFFGVKTFNKYSDILLAKLAAMSPPGNFDILHGQGNYSLESAIYAKSIGKIFISDVSGQMGLTRKKQLEKIHSENKVPFNNGIPILQERRFKEAKISDAIICPSESVRIELVKLGISDNKIYIANYDAPQAKKLININRANSVQKKIIKILYVGQISFSKGIHDIVDAFNNLHNDYDCTLELVGEIVNKELLKKRSSKISFHGKKTHNQLAKFYKDADIFVFPSYSEGSALVTQEAMASGLPTIATNQAGSLITHSINGYLYEAGDKKALTNFIELLIKNKNIRNKFSQNGRETIKLSMEEGYGTRVDNIYNHLLDMN